MALQSFERTQEFKLIIFIRGQLIRESPEYKWLCQHVGIISLSDVEKYCFTHSDLPGHIYGGHSRKYLTDFWLTGEIDSGEIKDTEFKDFEKDLLSDCGKLFEKCAEKGFLNK